VSLAPRCRHKVICYGATGRISNEKNMIRGKWEKNNSRTHKTKGMGMQIVERPAKTLIAHSSPRESNMGSLNRGKMAPQMQRRTTVAAAALAK